MRIGFRDKEKNGCRNNGRRRGGWIEAKEEKQKRGEGRRSGLGMYRMAERRDAPLHQDGSSAAD